MGWRFGSGLAALCLLAVPAWAGEQFTLTVPYAVNLDMDPARLASLLAAPEVQVVLNYEPLLAIPGWTGRFGYCAQRRYHVCLKKNWQPVVLEGAAVHRGGNSLSVDLPKHRWFGAMPYRINRTVRVTLPAVWPGDLPGNIDIYDIAQGRGQQPVVDMHLPAPYVGVGVYRLDTGTAPGQPAPYVVPPCDATLELDATGQPQVHPEHRAAAEEEWLRRLADSDWWAAQIPDVHYEQLAGLPAALAGTTTAGSQVIRVSLQRGGTHYTPLRARLPGLPGGRCPGNTRYDFSWLDDQLLAASQTESPDLDGPEQCPLSNITQEALWWQGALVSYTGPRVAGGDVTEWTRWKTQTPACLGKMEPTLPEVSGLQQAAALWRDYERQAQPLPVVAK